LLKLPKIWLIGIFFVKCVINFCIFCFSRGKFTAIFSLAVIKIRAKSLLPEIESLRLSHFLFFNSKIFTIILLLTHGIWWLFYPPWSLFFFLLFYLYSFQWSWRWNKLSISMSLLCMWSLLIWNFHHFVKWFYSINTLFTFQSLYL
jgi:hypothetical protein